MSKPKVVVTRKWPDEVERRLQELFDVSLNEDDHKMSVAELHAALQSADALCPTVSDAINAEVLNVESKQVKILGSYGVGFNHIDLDAARANELVVTNTPDVLTDCTADLAMTLLLMVARRAGEGERHVRHKEWSGWRPTHMIGSRVTGKTLGLVGMGRIARAMAHKAHHGFGMKIIFTDPYPPPEELVNSLQAESRASMDEVLAEADFVSLHCPGGKETYHLIDETQLAKMKPSAFLINSARGDVVDPEALIKALENGTIAGAGLDVFEGEPQVQQGFLELENAVLLPHLGSATMETRVAMGMRVIDNLVAYFAGEEPGDRVV